MEISEAFTAKRFHTCIYGTKQLALLLERLDLRSQLQPLYNERCDIPFSYCIYKWTISSYRKLSLNIGMDVVALHTFAKNITVLHFWFNCNDLVLNLALQRSKCRKLHRKTQGKMGRLYCSIRVSVIVFLHVTLRTSLLVLGTEMCVITHPAECTAESVCNP